MEDRDKLLIDQIAKKFEGIDFLFNQLSEPAKETIFNYHNEAYTLQYCIRWGLNGILEVKKEFCK